MTTEEKITNGVIRIENGSIKGLGCMDNGSFDLQSLEQLFNYADGVGSALAIDEIIMRIGMLPLYLHDGGPAGIDKKRLISDIVDMFPDSDLLYHLSLISKLIMQNKLQRKI